MPVPVAGCATAPPRCTTRGSPTSSSTEPLPPPSVHHHARPATTTASSCHHHRPSQLKQRDPATSVAEPCTIPVRTACCGPLPSRYDLQLPIDRPHERQRSIPASPLLVGGFLHRPPGRSAARTGLHVHASLTFSFEKDTLAPASTPDPSPFRFASSSSSPSSERLASRGTAPLCPGACLGLLALEGSHASPCVTNRFQILEGYHVSLRSPSALAVVHTPSLSALFLTSIYPDRPR